MWKLLILSCFTTILLFCAGKPDGNCGFSKETGFPDTLQCSICRDTNQAFVNLNLDSLFEVVELECKHFVVMQEIRKSKTFNVLYQNPVCFTDRLLQYIAQKNYSLSHRVWAIESQSGCDDAYCKFAKQVITLYEKGQIDDALVFALLNPKANQHLPFIRKDRDTGFTELLDLLVNSPNTSTDVKSFARDIQSGYVCSNIEHYR